MITHPIYLAMTAATVTIPASSDGIHAAGQHLIGIGLFISSLCATQQQATIVASKTVAMGPRQTKQVASLLDVSPRTVARDWRFASAFLKARLT